MTISAYEQLLIELINRARLNPQAEAERLGIALNDGLPAGTITATPKQVLAPDAMLETAAQGHSGWMQANDIFSHSGVNGSTPHQRMVAAGYDFSGNWRSGENLAMKGSTGPLDPLKTLKAHHDGLMKSAGHRANLFEGSFRELGVAEVWGSFSQNGITYPYTSMLTQNFALSGTAVFLTGVTYTDSDSDNFYSIGEAVSGVGFQAGGTTATSLEAGGYALRVGTPGMVDVIVQNGQDQMHLSVDLSQGNGKLDIVNGTGILTAVDTRIFSGVTSAQLLGIGNLKLTGGDEAEVLIGNQGSNTLAGGAGNDVIYGGAGRNTIYTGVGFDTVYGGSGDDVIIGGGVNQNRLFGNDGNDTITAGAGHDFLAGGAGNDVIFGGTGNNTIYLGLGNDFAGGGAGNDLIYGGAGSNRIWGGLGNDTVQGGTGSDEIYGGGNGRNWLFGNDGDDVITAGAGGDFLAGGAGNDTIYGGDGADTIYLGYGDDFAGGGAGNDVIYAGAGNNRIWGGLGNDTVHAGTGRDVISGGAGADVFVFASASHAGLGTGRDVITDFTPGTDKVDLSAMDLRFIGAAGFSGTAGELRYVPGFLIGDINGDGLNDFAIEMTGTPALTADDLIL